MSTVALTMIVKDEFDNVLDIVSTAYPHFQQIVLVVSDKTTWKKLSQTLAKQPKVEVYHRPWNNRFDEARNFALDKVTTDYWFWLDADDQFDFDVIPQLVNQAVQGDLQQILLPYHYAQDERGNITALHWRERLLQTSHPFTWKGWVHETPVTDNAFNATKIDIPVVHRADMDHALESLDRNHEILELAAKETDDPRYKMYLGMSLYARREYTRAIGVLEDFLQQTGSDEDAYRALGCMSECSYFLKDNSQAMQYAFRAAALIPEYPMAYWLLAQWENEADNYKEALEWVKVAESKPDPKTLAVIDPTSRDRARLIAAECHFMMKEYNQGLAWLRKVDPENPIRQELEDGFVNEADAETFIRLLPKMQKYFKDTKTLYDSLTYDIKYDIRLKGLRDIVEEPKTWSDKSIVILCGEGYEEWGPHTLDKGMGGSEEAVVYLSRELAKLGWEVTVYGAVDEYLEDVEKTPMPGGGEAWDRVNYLPWREINTRDRFNVFVAWRAPDFADAIKAKVKIADIHDIIPKDRVKDYGDLVYFVKSQFHKGLYPNLNDKNSRVLGNGIKKEQF